MKTNDLPTQGEVIAALSNPLASVFLHSPIGPLKLDRPHIAFHFCRVVSGGKGDTPADDWTLEGCRILDPDHKPSIYFENDSLSNIHPAKNNEHHSV
jgi:hypothetical protein